MVTIGPVVSEEKSFEIVDGRRRTTDPAYTLSSPGAFGSGELKKTFLWRGVGGRGARVSDFLKDLHQKKKKKICWGGGGGGGGGSENPNLEKKMVFFLRRGMREGTRVSDFFTMISYLR